MTGVRLPLLASLAVWTLAGCAYYNGLYNATQLTKEARRAEREGRRGEARSLWIQAAVKAESVVVRYPDSKYRDDALLMAGRALSRVDECRNAVGPLREAVRISPDQALRTEARFILAECHLAMDEPDSAWTTVTPLVASPDTVLGGRARWVRGRAAMARGRHREALADFQASHEPEATFDRAVALLELGKVRASASALDSARSLPFHEPRWIVVLDAMGAADVRVSASLIDRLVAEQDLTAGQAARLLIADGVRWEAVDAARAEDRYRTAVDIARDSVEASLARAHLAMAELRRSSDLARLPDLLRGLDGAMRAGGSAAAMAGPVAVVLEGVLESLRSRGEHGDVRLFRRAEEMRDVLGAADMAGQLFRRVERLYPRSVLAPKAVLAVAALRPEASDSVLAVLKERYPESPYTRAVLGHPAPEYAAVEDSIRHLLDAESLPRVRASAIGIAAGAVTVLPDTSLHDQESPKAPEGGGPSERPRR